MLKSQNEMNVPESNDEENVKNIEQLRNIVDESDKLYYDNLKKASNEESTEEGVTTEEVNPEGVTPEVVSPEEALPEEVTPEVVTPQETSADKKTLSNFKVETMESLESDDPWLSRKNK
jgi:hypothetical protein